MYRTTKDFDSGDLLTGSRICVACSKRQYMENFHWTGGRKYRSRKCKDCWREADRQRREVGKSTKSRSDHLRLKYQISEDTYDTLLSEQDGKCWICVEHMAPPYVDHCHTSGLVRGLLCGNCNKALGLLKDDPTRLERSIEYLTKPAPEIGYIPKYRTPEEVSNSKRKAVEDYVRSNPYAYSTRKMGQSGRLTDETVKGIVEMYSTGEYTQYQVAEHFGVSQATVQKYIKESKGKND